MDGGIVNSILAKLGYRLVRIRGRHPEAQRLQDRPEVQAVLVRIERDPLEASAHATLATIALRHGRPFLAHALARSAAWLTPGVPGVEALVRTTADALPPLADMGHNAYHRLQALAQVLAGIGCGPGSSLLDVGGGNGELAAFVPSARYFLADPVANGMAATDLPTGLGQFDYVVSCHVLEHVEPEKREDFLDALFAHTSNVVLLNPFHVEGTSERERLQLVIDLTDASWAREHLECSLPRLVELQAYAAARGLRCDVRPVGAMVATLAYVFVQHFARGAAMAGEFSRINRFFNEKLCEAAQSERFPTGLAVVLSRGSTSAGA